MRTRNSAGFTLLELLSVVLIVAILAGLAIPQYTKAVEKSRATEALDILGAVRASENRFKAQSPNNTYTGNPAELDLFDEPIQTRFWGTVPADLSLSTDSASLTRQGTGAYGGEVLGMQHATGTICGDYAKAILDATAQNCVISPL